MAVVAAAGPEHLPERGEVGGVLDVHHCVVVEALQPGRDVADRHALRLDQRDDPFVVVGVDDGRSPEPHGAAALQAFGVDDLDAAHAPRVVEHLDGVDHRVGDHLEVRATGTAAGADDRERRHHHTARRVAHVVAQGDRGVGHGVHGRELLSDVPVAEQRPPPVPELLPVVLRRDVADVLHDHAPHVVPRCRPQSYQKPGQPSKFWVRCRDDGRHGAPVRGGGSLVVSGFPDLESLPRPQLLAMAHDFMLAGMLGGPSGSATLDAAGHPGRGPRHAPDRPVDGSEPGVHAPDAAAHGDRRPRRARDHEGPAARRGLRPRLHERGLLRARRAARRVLAAALRRADERGARR